MKYRTKPNIKEAIQWKVPTIGENNIEEVAKFCNGGECLRLDAWRGLFIKTLEGEMHVSPGDYVVKGIKGEFYAVKPDIFEASYEPVED